MLEEFSHLKNRKLPDSPEERAHWLLTENERLYKVLEVNAVITSSLNLGFVLDTLMEKAKEVIHAEASSLMLVDEENQELFFHTVKGSNSETIKKIRLKIGEGISGWVAREKKPVLVEDAARDPRFSQKADRISSFVTRTMMCVPLIVNDRVLGTVQVLNKTENRFFNDDDLKIIQILAVQAAIAIENARLHEMATIDGATGLFVKRYFLARLKEEFRHSRLNNEPMSLIMSDIDFFKKVNDTYGHQGGDAALVELARVIRETVEQLDSGYLAGRYGGEEFCVLMPGAGPESAVDVAERIRLAIESTPIPIGESHAKITISVGVSSYPLHKEFIKEEEDFVRLADEALYLCKSRGRNNTSLYEKQKDS